MGRGDMDDCRFQHPETGWKCRLPTIDGESFCALHAPSTARGDEADPYEDLLAEYGLEEILRKHDGCLVGANLGDLDDSYARLGLDSNTELQLIDCDIGSLSIESAVIGNPLAIVDCDIEGDLRLSDSRFASDLRIVETMINGDVSADGALFGGNLAFERVQIGGETSAVGARFQGRVVFDNVDFSDIEVGSSESNFARTRFDREVVFHDTDFYGQASFQEATFTSAAEFTESEFGGGVDFARAEITSVIFDDTLLSSGSFDATTFDTRARFTSAALTGRVTFENASIGCPLELDDCDVQGGLSLNDATCEEEVIISGGELHGEISLIYATIHDDLTFSPEKLIGKLNLFRGVLRGDLEVTDTMIGGSLEMVRLKVGRDVSLEETFVTGGIDATNAEVRDDVEIVDGEFGDDLRFDYSSFHGSVLLKDLEVEGGVSFVGAALDHRITVTDAVIDGPERAHSRVDVDLAGAKVPGGHLGQSGESDKCYDLSRATVGDIELDVDRTERLSENYLFARTNFDGFDFSEYRRNLEEHDWEIHAPVWDDDGASENERDNAGSFGQGVRFLTKPLWENWVTITTSRRITGRDEPDGGPEDQMSEGRLEALQTTYLKAKNGANQVGTSKVAAEFFRMEMHFRQVGHAVDIHSSERRRRNRGIRRWIEQAVLRSVSGFGERPKRVMGASFFTIGLFGALFASVFRTTVGGYDDAVLLSAGSFVTLVFGGSSDIGDPVVQFIAQIEGFIGAFLIAVFVFTLTRSIHR